MFPTGVEAEMACWDGRFSVWNGQFIRCAQLYGFVRRPVCQIYGNKKITKAARKNNTTFQKLDLFSVLRLIKRWRVTHLAPVRAVHSLVTYIWL